MNESSYYSAPGAVCENVTGPASARVYKDVFVKNTELGPHASVGDFSRVEDSVLGERTQLQRNNMVYHSRIGRYTFTGRNTTVWHADIGAFCSISSGVSKPTESAREAS